jgi:hypothetical protein
MVETKNPYRILVAKPEGSWPLGRQIHASVDNIKVDLVDIGWGSEDWIGLARIDTSGELL